MNYFIGALRRILQILSRFLPGARGLRIALHRMRGVQIGHSVFIGTDVIIETAHPDRVKIGNRVVIGLRATLMAHFDGDMTRETPDINDCLVIEDDTFIGPCALILPHVTIGRGAVVAAGSVVTRSVPNHCMVQGNPAEVIARADKPLNPQTSTWAFVSGLRRIKRKQDEAIDE